MRWSILIYFGRPNPVSELLERVTESGNPNPDSEEKVSQYYAAKDDSRRPRKRVISTYAPDDELVKRVLLKSAKVPLYRSL